LRRRDAGLVGALSAFDGLGIVIEHEEQ